MAKIEDKGGTLEQTANQTPASTLEIKKDTTELSSGNQAKSTPKKDAVDELGVPIALKEVMAKKRKADKEMRETEKKERAKKTVKDTEDIAVEEPEKTEVAVPAGDTAKERFEEVLIDPRLVAAGRAKNWSDEKIIKQAEEDESVLVDLADALDILNARRKEPEQQPEKKESKPALSKVELDKEAVKTLSDNYGEDVVSKIISPLADRLNEAIDTINALRGGVDKFSEGQKKEANARRMRTADEIFDKVANTYPVLGKTTDIPTLEDGSYSQRSPIYQERNKIFKIADMFHNSNGGSFEDAMKDAMRWYGGGNVDALKRKVIADINEQAKGHLPRPTAKKVEPSYETREEEGVAIVRAAKERAVK